MRASGATTLPRDLDIFSIFPVFSERAVIIPWLKSTENGSSLGTIPKSYSTL